MPHRRRTLFAAPLALLLAALSVVSLAPPSASAAPAPFTLALVSGQGRVQLGDNPEPLLIGDPTTMAGTIDDVTGAITGVSFSTPDIPFQQESSGLQVDIVATFTELVPGANSGQADGLGNVRIDIGLRLDLHVDVGGGAIVTDCTSSPIHLQLVSTAPYDPATQRVTLVDPQVTIPPVVAGDTCNSLVVGPINDQLAGDDNSLSFVMEGPLALPPPPGDPSTTALAADRDTTPMGHPVTFTATVEPPEATGTVTFRNGPVNLGQVLMDGGTATLTTSALSVGVHQITAEYSGDTDYDRSTSAPLTHTVTAVPTITANFPTHIVAGADPVEFTATIVNPSAGGPLPNLRVDWRFGRVGGNTNATNFSNTRFVLEYRDGADWVPVPLARRTTPAPADDTGTLAGSYGGSTGFSLPVGQQRTVTFRVSATADVAKGPMPVHVRLNTVAPDNGAVLTTLSQQTVTSALVGSERYTAAVSVAAVIPTVIRPGYLLQFSVAATRTAPAPIPNMTGAVEVHIDGQRIDVYTNPADPPGASLPVSATGSVLGILMPDQTVSLVPGTHTLAVRYTDDPVYQPSWSEPVTFQVLPLAGPVYECTLDLILAKVPLRGRVEIQADLPAAAPAGSTLTPGRLLIQAVLGVGGMDLSTLVIPDGDRVAGIELTPGGTGTFADLSAVVHGNGVDQTLTFVGATVTVPVTGQPGDVVDIGLDDIRMAFPFLPGANASLGCAPAVEGELALVGSVVVSGTTVSGPSAPVEQGTPLALAAAVFPTSAQGVVEFLAGSTSLGIAPVAAGRADLVVSDLPEGTHQVTARYLGDMANPPSVSAATPVVVRDVVLCPDQAGTGHAAVVRAAYLHLLGRCADAAGFAYWTGRLDGGLAGETFARQIAGSLEAHARSVDDAYALVLGRPAEAAGRAYWAARLQAGRRYDHLVADLAASAEFWDAAGRTPGGFVDRLYERLLGRAPDAAGRQYWVDRLAAGRSRAAVAVTLVRLAEPAGAQVRAAYQALLHRPPTPEELAPAVARFQADGHRARIYSALIGTEEFSDLAQDHPNP